MGDALPTISLGTGKVPVSPAPAVSETIAPTPGPTVAPTPTPTSPPTDVPVREDVCCFRDSCFVFRVSCDVVSRWAAVKFLGLLVVNGLFASTFLEV